MIAAYDDDRAIGFLTLRDLDASTAEIHVIGILPAYHRRGIGRRMIAMAADDCRRRGLRTLEVLTLGAAHPDPNYARTRSFYRAVGFVPLRESELEDGTPMLTMALALESGPSRSV
jgi:ribosomal protein S18 acetylase RimI-like enzyme